MLIRIFVMCRNKFVHVRTNTWTSHELAHVILHVYQYIKYNHNKSWTSMLLLIVYYVCCIRICIMLQTNRFVFCAMAQI